MSDTPIFDEVAAELWENHHIRYSQLVDDTVVLRPKSCKADIVYISGTPSTGKNPQMGSFFEDRDRTEEEEQMMEDARATINRVVDMARKFGNENPTADPSDITLQVSEDETAAIVTRHQVKPLSEKSGEDPHQE